MSSKPRKIENVVFENTLNDVVNINKLKKIELKLFYALVMAVHNKGTDRIVIDVSELKETTRYKVATKEEWVNIIDKTTDKVLPLFWRRRTKTHLDKIMLFRELTYEIDNDILIVRINEGSEFIFNDIKKTFTKFGWANFVRLNSKYAQILFPKLQQYNSIGKRVFTKEELFKLLDVPESMRIAHNFNKRILNPIKEEFSDVFIDFEITAHRGRGKGRPVVAYEFKWNNDSYKARIEQKQQKEAMEARREFHESLKNRDSNKTHPDDYYDWIGEIKKRIENK